MRLEEALDINIFSHGQSTIELNAYFVHSNLLIDVLLRMKPSEKDKQEFISLLKDKYKNDNKQLDIVRELACKYSAEKSIWWYTRPTFIYEILNKALRDENIYLIFLFMIFINN